MKEGVRIHFWTALALLLFHVGAAAGLFFFSWQRLALAGVVWTIAGLGITVGFHRLLTHRSFRTSKTVEHILSVCGCLAVQGSPIQWASSHRLHHRKTEMEGDPHTTKDGFWWAHVGWILRKDPAIHNWEFMQESAPDLCKDRFQVWLGRYYGWVIGGIIGVFLLFGLPVVLWYCVSVVFGWHAAWAVNSAAHTWGQRRFETSDNSRNSWWVALLTFGEGWHNNHHHSPRSARHGLAWYEPDPSWWVIRLLQICRVAWDVKIPG